MLATTALPAHALPSTMFSDGANVGNVHFDLYSDSFGNSHIYGWENSDTTGDSTLHKNGELWFYDAVADDSWWASCDEGTADETADGNDTVLTCDAETAGLAYADLSVKPEFRIFPADENGVATIRVLYAVTNTGAEDVTVDELRSSADLDEAYGEQSWNNGGSFYGYPVFDNRTDLNWFTQTSYDASSDEQDPSDDSVKTDFTTIGSAWQNATAAVKFTANGDFYEDDEISLLATDVVFPAGQTRYFAFFTVAAYIPEGATDEEAETITAHTNAAMANFEGPLVGALAAGIPADADIANWNSTPEELAETGVEGSDALGMAVLLLFAGAATVIIRRRARA